MWNWRYSLLLLGLVWGGLLFASLGSPYTSVRATPAALLPPSSLRCGLPVTGGATAVFAPGPAGAPPPRSLPVDIVLKLAPHHGMLAASLFTSLRLLWPGYTSIVLVVDDAKQARASSHALVSVPRAAIMLEPLVNGNSYWGNMHSNMWADNYTSAPFIAIMDCDVVMRARVDRDALVLKNKLVLRYLSCNASEPLPPGEFAKYEASNGCRYGGSVSWLLGVPYPGNFMVVTPLVINRGVLPALRAHVEARHGKPFDAVMDEMWGMMRNQVWRADGFAQHSAIGAFIHAFPHLAGAELDGGDGVDGVTGYTFFAWGRGPSFPMVGGHMFLYKKSLPPPEYAELATSIITRGMCYSYYNVAPAVCPPPERAAVWRWEFESVTAPADSKSKQPHPYDEATASKSCYVG